MITTFGHSTLGIDDAVNLLNQHEIKSLIDIRSHPTSRWDQWQKPNLEKWLPKQGIKYEWWEDLGGWSAKYTEYSSVMAEHEVDVNAYAKGKFPKQRISVGRQFTGSGLIPSWTNQGLWDYQFFMTTTEFLNAISELVAEWGTNKEKCAIFCGELLWWRCHRSMVADILFWLGVEISHLQPKLTRHADVIGNRIERYDAYVIARWDEFFNKI